jgi:hypothetical protein
MRILCVADHEDPLVYSNSIKERFKNIDLILGAGDLAINYYEYIISCLNKRLYFVLVIIILKNCPYFAPEGMIP